MSYVTVVVSYVTVAVSYVTTAVSYVTIAVSYVTVTHELSDCKQLGLWHRMWSSSVCKHWCRPEASIGYIDLYIQFII